MACPVTKSLTVSFTPPNPTPSNGYRIKWRVVGTSTYTTAVGPFLSSPATLTNIPTCEDIEGTVESSCGGSFSSVATFTVSKEATYTCADQVTGSNASGQFYIYPKKVYDLANTGDTITLNWDVAGGVPNRFTVYNSLNQIALTTGWKGISSNSGPWGSSPLNTPTFGTNTFSKAAAGGDGRWYYLVAETVGQANTTDSWSATIACTSNGGGGGGGTPSNNYTIGLAFNAEPNGTVDCLGTTYNTARGYVRATLYNNGVATAAASNITVTYRKTYTPCVGQASDGDYTITILSGQSSGVSETWDTETTVDCGQYGCNLETTVYSCAVSNSANYSWAVGTTAC